MGYTPPRIAARGGRGDAGHAASRDTAPAPMLITGSRRFLSSTLLCTGHTAAVQPAGLVRRDTVADGSPRHVAALPKGIGRAVGFDGVPEGINRPDDVLQALLAQQGLDLLEGAGVRFLPGELAPVGDGGVTVGGQLRLALCQ